MSIFDRILVGSEQKIDLPKHVEPGLMTARMLKTKPKPIEAPVQVEQRQISLVSFTPKASKFKGTQAFGPVGNSPDLKRVLALPRRPALDLASKEAQGLCDDVTRTLTRGPRKCACKIRHANKLNTVQAWALHEAAASNGMLGIIGVGNGKTWLDVLMPMVMPKCSLAVVLIPPGLKQQLWDEYEALSEHFVVPSIVFDDGVRGRIIPGRTVLHVLPYSKLSRPESTDILTKLSPDLIIADEAHRLSHMATATVRRFLRYLAGKPETRFCGWSGTLTKKSIKDYAHLAAIALGEGSPLPLEPQIVDEWATAIDPSDWPAPKGALGALVDGVRAKDLYEGFRYRLIETPGVVSTKSSGIEASINLFERKAPDMPAHLVEMLDILRDGWERPDGEELVEVTEKVRCLKELACGFYYRWRYPKGTPTALIDQWLAARKAWHRELRAKLEHPVEHMDSPMLCANAAARAWSGYKGPLPTWKAHTWPAWAEIKDKVKHDTEAVWVSDYMAEDAAAWADKHKGPIWYEYSAFGQRIAEISGLPLHGGGPNAEALIKAEKGDKSIVASIKAHGTGRDGLQRLFFEQLFANAPSSGDIFEQALGRLHRVGQPADEVNSWVYRHTTEMRNAIDRAVIQAKYIQGTFGSSQKLLAASCDFSLLED